MKHLFRYGAAPLLLALTACPAAKPDQTQTSARSGSPAAAAAPLADFRQPGYAQYRGLVAGAADSLTLCLTVLPAQPGSATGGIAGNYFGADGELHDIQQLSEPRPVPDSLRLVHYPPDALSNPNDQPATRWLLRRQPDGRLVGTVGGQAAVLWPVRPVLGFTAQSFADSVAAFPGQASSPYGHVSLQTLVPVGTSAVAQAVAGHLNQMLRGDSLPGSPAPTAPRQWQQQRAAFLKEYRADAKAMAVEPIPTDPDEAESYAASLRYESQSSVDVLCQQGPLLSVRFTNSEYTGGAHGNYGSAVYSFDLRTGRWLTYNELFRPEARQRLLPLLDRGVRRTVGLGANEPLDSVLLVKQMPLTKNVCLVPGGVLFVYAPYEIAAYALGEVQVFVPLAEVHPLLREGLPLPGSGGAVARR